MANVRPRRPRSRDEFRIGIICALVLEAEMVMQVFDHNWDEESGFSWDRAIEDQDAYSTGNIAGHNVVLIYHPSLRGAQVASMVAGLQTSFPRVELLMFVGICGVVPFNPYTHEEIVLGDCIFSTGVIDFSMSRQYPQGFAPKTELVDSLGRTSVYIRSIMTKLEISRNRAQLGHRLVAHLQKLQTGGLEQSAYPGSDRDRLYEATYPHRHHLDETCEYCSSKADTCRKDCYYLGCDLGALVHRRRFEKSLLPEVHLGLFASFDGNPRSALIRDNIAQTHKVIAFDHEAAHSHDIFPAIIIKAAYDYADGHITKQWQSYAAAVAAAGMKAFLDDLTLSVENIEESLESLEPLALLPFTRDHDFVGREQLLDEMLRRFDDRPTSSQYRLALVGMPGVGKSQIAIEYAYRLRERHPEHSIFWVYASNARRFEQSYKDIASYASIDVRDQSRLLETVHQWLSLHRKSWTLILDDVLSEKTFTMVSDNGKALRDYLPTTKNGTILMTTQNRDAAITLVGFKSILYVECLQESESLQLFHKKTEIDNEEAARKLIHALSFHPMAITHAAGLITMRAGRLPVSRYLKLFESTHNQIELLYRITGFNDIRRDPSAPKTIEEIFEMPFDEIRRRSPAAIHILALMSAFDVQYIPQESLNVELQFDNSFEDAVAMLINWSLVTNDNNNRTFDIHPLVQTSMKLWMQKNNRKIPQLPIQSPEQPRITTSIAKSLNSEEAPDIFSVMSQDLTNPTSKPSVQPLAPKADPLADDAASIYSTAMSVSDPANQSQIDSMAEQLWRCIESSPYWQSSAMDLQSRIPDLLKAFACQLGYNNLTKEYLDAMLFIRMFRKPMVDTIKVYMSASLNQTAEVQPDGDVKPNIPVPEMSLEDKMAHWNHMDRDVRHDHQPQEANDSVADSDDQVSTKIEPADLYSHIVLNSTEFQWLLKRIDREIKYQRSDPDCMGEIARQLMQLQPNVGKISRRVPEPIQVIFTFNWSLSLLSSSTERLRNRKYMDEEIVTLDTIEQALVLTGGPTDAMAVTCEEYIEAIWSERGRQLLYLFKKALKDPGEVIEGQVIGITSIEIQWQEDLLKVWSTSEIHAIAELGEILGWLAVALQPSNSNGAIPPYTMTPTMSLSEILRKENNNVTCGNKTFVCHFSHEWHVIESKPRGQCWFDMFEDLAITIGYPILRRTESGHGLEISLPVMAVMLRTNRTIVRNGKLAVRESTQALVPASRTEDTIIWHYIYEEDGDPVLYWKAHSHHVNLKTNDLFHTRHIVGWCSKAITIAGAYGDHYNIYKSGLPAPSSKMILESINVSGSQFVGATLPIKLGIRRSALHVTADTFAAQISMVSRNYVLLWDDKEKRGWLLDGLSALLHILRTSLHLSTKDKLRTAFCLEMDSIQDPQEDLPDAAIGFFFQNKDRHPYMKKQLYPGATEDDAYLMHHRVKELCNILQEAIQEQAKLSFRDGFQFSTSPRQDLQGWNFIDFATIKSRVEPCSAKLDWKGAAWVDLIRSIDAVVLFGQNFGEVIRPAETNGICERWSTLPLGQYCIATYGSTITTIINEYGDAGTSPVKLTKNLVWHDTTALFKACGCKGRSQKHTDLVQTILPAKFHSLLQEPHKVNYSRDSAIIFGQNKYVPWWWPDCGDPCKTKKPRDNKGIARLGGEQERTESSHSSSRQMTDNTSEPTPETSSVSQNASSGVEPEASRLSRLRMAIIPKGRPMPPPSENQNT